jgi:hypothetical protein
MLQQVDETQGLPHFGNIYLSGIRSENSETFVHCVGMEQSIIRNVEMTGLDIWANKAGIVSYTDNFKIKNSIIKTPDDLVIEEGNNTNFEYPF